jgi:DNA-binding SARP family transcriptional activator
MTAHIVLLGPLCLRGPGGLLVLPAGRPQAVLVALLLARGTWLSADRLAESLWDEPPRSAAANLRTYVSRLRAALGPYQGRLLSSAAGYAFRVEPGELDLDRFEEAVGAARKAERSGSPALAADRYAAALGLWSGDAAECVPRFGALGRALDALAEQRRATVERYAESCLAAGRYAAAIDALRPLVAAEAGREVAWELLVTAHLRAGDRSGARAAWTGAVAALRAEVDHGPGDVLRELGDQLGVPGPEPAPADSRRAAPRPGAGPGHAEPRPRPARDAAPVSMLPPAVELVGRDALVATLTARLREPAVVALSGPAGVGKSALAVGVATALAGHYPGGALYLDLCGNSPGLVPMTVEESVTALLRALGSGGAVGSLGAAVAELTLRVTGRRVLVVLDNAVDAGAVRRLLPALRDAAVLVTSRTMLSTLDIEHVGIGELAADDAVTLLARYAETRVAAAPADARTLARLCGGLPLALRIVGARMADHPEWTVAMAVDRLGDERYRLDELASDDLAVRSGLGVTCRLLADRPAGTAALTVFDRWGACCVPVLDPDLARVLLGGAGGPRPVPEARAALDRLAEAGLIEPCGGGRYRTHDLVRIYALERGRARADRAVVLHAARRYWLATARRARDALRPNPRRVPDEFAETTPTVRFAGHADAQDWLEAHRVDLFAAAQLAGQEQTVDGDRFVVRLSAELYPFLPMRAYYREWHALAALALVAARRLRSRPDEATALTHLSVARGRLGENDAAVTGLREALALREAEGDRRAMAVTLDHLAARLAAAGQLAEARTCFERALPIHREQDDARSVGVTLNNLADVLLQLGQTAAALDCLEESMVLRRTVADELGLGITMLTIGQVHARNDDRAQAYRWLGDALGVARRTGNREAEWRALTVRADVHRADGRADRARDDLVAALTLSEHVRDDAGIDQVRRALAALTG